MYGRNPFAGTRSLAAAVLMALALSGTSQALESYRVERFWPVLQQPYYFARVSGAAVDAEGNVYLLSTGFHRVHKYTSGGRLVSEWGGHGSAPGQFDQPHGIAAAPLGGVYVADTFNHRVQQFSQDGGFVRAWGSQGVGPGQFNGPVAVGAAPDGTIYVTDKDNHRVQQFTAEGEFIRSWGGLGSSPGQFLAPEGIAIDPAGHVYVVDKFNHRIQQFDAGGTFIAAWGGRGTAPGQLDTPRGIGIDGQGRIVAADTGNNRVQLFDSQGGFAQSWDAFANPYGIGAGLGGFVYVAERQFNRVIQLTETGETISVWSAAGTAGGYLDRPAGIARDASGNLYVVDAGNRRVQHFSPTGRPLRRWGAEGDGPGEFRFPYGIAIGQGGEVYVCDLVQRRIQKFSAEGEFLLAWGGMGEEPGQFLAPAHLAVHPGNGQLFVVDTVGNRVQRFTSQGEFIAAWGEGGAEPGQMHQPLGIAVSAAGMVYIADSTNNRVQEFTTDGELVRAWGAPGTGPGEFDVPDGVAVDSEGNVYVADARNHRIQKFDAEGQYLLSWGGLGSGPGRMSEPAGIAIAPDGSVFVTDQHNHRIQKFRPVVLTENAKAIVVAGGGPYPGNHIWAATQASANFAYRALMTQGFTPDEIFYLSADTELDLTNNGEPDVDADATAANLQFTLTEWAPAALNDLPTGDVVVYLVNHGGHETFRIQGGEVVTAAELANWLNTLQSGINGTLTVIYDACESGSFLDALRAPGRIVITSSAAQENAYFLSTGAISFSTFFWTHVFNGLSVFEAYALAEQALGQTIGFQTPHLADPGNLAASTFIGNGVSHSGARPEIGGVAATPQTLSGGTTEAVIAAEPVLSDEDIVRVWAVIRPPDFFIEDPSAPVQNLPSVELRRAPGTDRWEGVYDNFTVEGAYQLAVYARNRLLNTSLPGLTTVTVNSPLRRRAVLALGGGQADAQWPAVEEMGRTAYRALRGQGYPDADIRYYSATATEGVDGSNTKANLEHALTQWAATDTRDLAVYLAGQGTAQSFRLNADETVSAGELAGWLDTLQESIPGRVTVVIDAPQSGSFIAPLAPPPGQPRTLIASATSSEAAAFLAKGDVSFSSYFWRQILNGAALESAFRHARLAMQFSGGGQQAQLDDDGNGIPNERTDGIASRRYRLGAGVMLAGDAPIIGAVSPGTTLETSPSAVIWAENVTTTAEIDEVFAVITPPGFSAAKSLKGGADRLIVTLAPAGGGRYEAHYHGFRKPGTYELAIFARDHRGNLSLPKTTQVAQTAEHPEGDCAIADVNQDGHIDAVDIQLVINAALGIAIPHDADVNNDGGVNAVDIQIVINAALGICSSPLGDTS